jgi:hypothetical protein
VILSSYPFIFGLAVLLMTAERFCHGSAGAGFGAHGH